MFGRHSPDLCKILDTCDTFDTATNPCHEEAAYGHGRCCLQGQRDSIQRLKTTPLQGGKFQDLRVNLCVCVINNECMCKYYMIYREGEMDRCTVLYV